MEGLRVETSSLKSRNNQIRPVRTRSRGILQGKKSAKRNKPFKMAAKSLTEEFYDSIFSDNYAMTIEQPKIIDCITSSKLYHLRKYTSKSCNLLTNQLIDKKGQAIPSGVFQIFSVYSGKNPSDIRDDLLRWASKREEEVCNLAKPYFKSEHINFTSWYVKTSNVNKGTHLFLVGYLCNLSSDDRVWSSVIIASNVGGSCLVCCLCHSFVFSIVISCSILGILCRL